MQKFSNNSTASLTDSASSTITASFREVLRIITCRLNYNITSNPHVYVITLDKRVEFDIKFTAKAVMLAGGYDQYEFNINKGQLMSSFIPDQHELESSYHTNDWKIEFKSPQGATISTHSMFSRIVDNQLHFEETTCEFEYNGMRYKFIFEYNEMVKP